jgi:hypothetical protein
MGRGGGWLSFNFSYSGNDPLGGWKAIRLAAGGGNDAGN